MTSTKQKGQKKELLCAKELASQGFFIAFRAFTVKRGPCYVGVDFGNTFDIVALKAQVMDKIGFVEKPPEWLFVSCSFASHRAEKVAAVRKFKETFYYFNEAFGFEPWHFDFQCWIWTPARYRGRGKNRHFEQAKWEKIVV